MNSVLIASAVFLLFNSGETLQRSSRGIPEDAALDFPQLAQKYGFNVEERNVTTEDGYILKIFHIPGNKKKAVLIMHGIFDSADTFFLRGRKSLAAVLAQKGYDVWFGNTRGNKYSRRHVRLNPDTDKEFWDFSFHEMGVIDLRVFIDLILGENQVQSLSLIGHSLGNTLFYVLGSMKPEYNDKINIAIALAPVCYLNINNFQMPINLLLNLGYLLNQWLEATNQEEIFGDKFFLVEFSKRVCKMRGLGYLICAAQIFAEIGGEDLEELEPEMFYSVIGHYPTSSSRKTLYHFVQLGQRNEFAQFDYGPQKNIEIYKSKTSPLYDLEKVTMKVALFVGKNDKLTPLKNVVILRDKLPNVVTYHVMDREKFNHIDHLWGKNMDKFLYPRLIKVLDTYSQWRS